MSQPFTRNFRRLSGGRSPLRGIFSEHLQEAIDLFLKVPGAPPEATDASQKRVQAAVRREYRRLSEGGDYQKSATIRGWVFQSFVEVFEIRQFLIIFESSTTKILY